MSMAIANLLTCEEDYPDQPPSPTTSSQPTSPQSSWDGSSSEPGSPFSYSSSPTPSSPATATAERKTSLAFILNNDEDESNTSFDLSSSAFGVFLPISTSTTSTPTRTSDKRKREHSESDEPSSFVSAGRKCRRRTKSDVATSTKERSLRLPSYASIFTEAQREALEEAFAIDPLPNAEAKTRIAESMGVSPKSVQLWFQNQRSKLRKREKKRQAREEARRQAALSKPKYIFHNLQATSKANGFLHRFVDVGQH